MSISMLAPTSRSVTRSANLDRRSCGMAEICVLPRLVAAGVAPLGAVQAVAGAGAIARGHNELAVARRQMPAHDQPAGGRSDEKKST